MAGPVGFPSTFLIFAAVTVKSDDLVAMDDLIGRKRSTPYPAPSSILRLPLELLLYTRELLFSGIWHDHRCAASKRLCDYQSTMIATACKSCKSRNNSFRRYEDLWRPEPKPAHKHTHRSRTHSVPSVSLPLPDCRERHQCPKARGTPRFDSYIAWLQATFEEHAKALRRKRGICSRTGSAVWDLVAEMLQEWNCGWMGDLTSENSRTVMLGETAARLLRKCGVDGA